MSDTKKYLGYFSIILFIAVLFIVGILLGRDKKGFLDLPKTGEIDNESETSIFEIINVPYSDMNEMNPPVTTDVIDTQYKYLRKGSLPNSVYIEGFITDYLPNQEIKFKATTPDLKFSINATCKINSTTEFSNITLKVIDGKQYKTKTLMTNVSIDKNIYTLLSIQYTNDSLFSSQDNICITVEQTYEL